MTVSPPARLDWLLVAGQDVLCGTATTRAFCHYATQYPFCMDNPYRYSKCQ